MEGWQREKYRNAGIQDELVQFNVSRSAQGVVRGLHYQEPNPQGKLVMCLEGCVLDYAVDIREGSPTFGEWWSCQLDDETHTQFWVPPGFAHGFEVMSQSALFAYLVSEVFQPEHDRSIRFDDPDIGIKWQTKDPKLSPKDEAAPMLKAARVLPQYS